MKTLISVVSPSIRQGGLDMVARCLESQTLRDWEWIVSTNYDPPAPAIQVGLSEKKPGLFYTLNRDWNRCFRKTTGELIVSIVDQTWFPPDTLEQLWTHYENNPTACVGAIGHQYQVEIDGKPQVLVWSDPRARQDHGSFYEILPIDLEFCVASVPRTGLFEAGGMDEAFDQFAALSEKELCWRLDKLGYTFWLDQSLEYRAVKHERLNGQEAWDKAYFLGCDYFDQCYREIQNGARLKLDYLQE